MGLKAVTGCLAAASLILTIVSTGTAQAEDSRTFLYDEQVEIYSNAWSAVRLTFDYAGQVDVHIRGEGKTAQFDGILSMNCESGGGQYWITAANLDMPLTSDDAINNAIPPQVIPAARAEYCN